jgi:hypothetical protein
MLAFSKLTSRLQREINLLIREHQVNFSTNEMDEAVIILRRCRLSIYSLHTWVLSRALVFFVPSRLVAKECRYRRIILVTKMFGYGKLLFVVEGTRKSLVTISVVSLIVNTLREYPGLKNSSYM